MKKLVKNIKKLITGAAILALPLMASAQIGSTYSFINTSFKGIYISNSVTFLTNLLSSVNGVGTNITGVVATNSAGVAQATNNIYNVNLLRTIPNWTDRNGKELTGAGTNSAVFINIPAGTAGANATNGFTIVLSPAPNGTNDSSQSADWLTISTIGGTSVAGQWVFYYPNTKWPGVRGIMCQKVYSTVAPAAAASQFVISELSVSGFIP